MFEALAQTEYATWVRESLWGWPMALTVHAFGTAAVIGLTFIIVLRLLGLFRTIPYTSLSRLFPVIWVGVVFQVMSGFSLWMTKPEQYVGAGMFVSKFTFVVIGIIVTLFFQSTIKREAAAWEAAGTVSSRGVKFAAAAALVWSAVLVTGRLTAYLGSLYA